MYNPASSQRLTASMNTSDIRTLFYVGSDGSASVLVPPPFAFATDGASTASASASEAVFRPFYEAWLDHMLKSHPGLSSQFVDLPEAVVIEGRMHWEKGNQAYLGKVRHPCFLLPVPWFLYLVHARVPCIVLAYGAQLCRAMRLHPAVVTLVFCFD